MENAQPVKVEVIFSEKFPVGIYGYALVLTNRLVSISSDGQRMFDLTEVIKLYLHEYKNNNINNRTLIIGFSICGKTYLINENLFQKQEPVFISKKSLSPYPNNNAQTSDEIQPLEQYENSTVVFDDMLLSKQESNIDLFLTRGCHNNIDN